MDIPFRDQLSNPVSRINEITIECLNDDCLVQIFEYLNIQEKLKIQAVNKRWNLTAKLSWRKTEFSLAGVLPDKILTNKSKNTEKTNFMINILKNNGSYLRKLSLKSYLFKYFEIKLLFKSLEKYCNNLTYLSIEDNEELIKDEYLTLLFRSNANLRSIRFRLYNSYLNGDCLLNLHADRINELSLEYCTFESKPHFYGFLANLKNLSKFNINTSVQEFIPVIDALIMSKCENLREFSFQHWIDIPNSRSISLLLSKQKKLKELSLSGVKIDSNLIENLPGDSLEIFKNVYINKNNSTNNPLQSFYLLRNLKVFNCHFEELNDNDLISLTTTSNFYLKKITIRFHDYSLSKNLINKFKMSQNNYSLLNESESKFKVLPNLEYLNIKYGVSSDKMTEDYKYIDVLLHYFSEFTNLKKLIITKCNFNTSDYDLVSFFPKLEALTITDSVAINSDIVYFVKNSICLKKIILNFCYNIDEEVIKEISDIKNHRGDRHILKILFQLDEDQAEDFDEEKYENISPLLNVNYEYIFD